MKKAYMAGARMLSYVEKIYLKFWYYWVADDFEGYTDQFVLFCAVVKR